MGSQLHCCLCPKYACSMGDRKGLVPKYVLHLWVGWPLQHKIIDGPACQGVLIWDEGVPGGCVGCLPATAYTKSDTCAF